jgi:hypothetical protein
VESTSQESYRRIIFDVPFSSLAATVPTVDFFLCADCVKGQWAQRQEKIPAAFLFSSIERASQRQEVRDREEKKEKEKELLSIPAAVVPLGNG